MQKIDGTLSLNEITPEALKKASGGTISGCACVHKIRRSSGFSFVYLRTGRFIFQAVYLSELCEAPLKGIAEGTYIEFTGTVKEEPRADYGCEITLTGFSVLSAPSKEYPVNISDKVMSCTLETNLAHRALALRHPHQRAILKISEAVTDGFTSFMKQNNFTQIHSPKISADVSVNDANMFRFRYFDTPAVLTSDSIFSKQAAVAVFDRIFEISHAYRANKHNSTRHLNEYIRLDFEMAFVTDIAELMNVQTAFLRYTLDHIKKTCSYELELLGIRLPEITSVPAITFTDAMKTLEKSDMQTSLDPMDESKLSELAKTEYNSDFVFITNLPSAKQPFYIMDCPDNPELSECFVMLYKGREITYGGRRIHDYAEQTKKLSKSACDELYDYLDLHRYALPPHGGAGTGLERLVAGLLNLENIKEATLFPRDMHHCSI